MLDLQHVEVKSVILQQVRLSQRVGDAVQRPSEVAYQIVSGRA